jgi:hypothetical protein
MHYGLRLHYQGRKGLLIVLGYLGGRGGGMNLKWYEEQVLNGVLLDFVKEVEAEMEEVMFQQDGASSHHSKSTQKWFK